MNRRSPRRDCKKICGCKRLERVLWYNLVKNENDVKNYAKRVDAFMIQVAIIYPRWWKIPLQ